MKCFSIQTLLVSIGLVILFAPAEVFARSGRVNQFPHGNQIGCLACHLQSNGSGLTDFGFASSRYTTGGNLDWNQEFAEEDADRDGYTNGYELGDPNGSWNAGDGAPGGAFWDPGDRDDSPCGNGTVDGPEACDGAVPQGMNCDSLGLGPGNLGCDSCQFTTENCGACGDGNLNPGFEDCDGADLQDATCQSVGYDQGGTLACEVGGCAFDTSGCVGPGPDGQCGDGELQATEQCDGDNIGGLTCVLMGYDGGVLGCFLDCTLDFIGCFGGDEGDNNTSNNGGNNDPGNNNDQDPVGPPGSDDYASSEINLGGSCATTGATAPSALLMFGLFFILRRRRQRRA